MTKNYFKRSAMMLGATALICGSSMAETKWQNVNYLLPAAPAGVTGWSGALTDVDTNEQVAEIYNGAGKVYQVLKDMPAGDYTLTVNAFLRATTNEAYIFINDTKKVIANHDGDCDNLNGARLAFEGGKYLNTVTATHKGGDMVIGIMNPKSELYEWMAFDNFKLVNGTVDCTDKIVNADFSEESGLDFVKNGWTCKSGKTPELKRGGGNYSKTNASGYDIHQTVTLPAGKYRFAANTFLRHGAGNTAGGAWSIKAGDGAGIGTWYETTSAYDRHVANAEDPTWAAYIYVNEGEWDDDLEGLEEDGLFYYATPIKCLFDLGDELGLKNTELPDNAWEGSTQDSGDQSQSSEFFIKYADATSHYVEFTLDAETEVSMGIKKAVNAPERYWNAFADLRLEQAVEGGSESPVDPVDPTDGEWQNVNYLLPAAPAGVTGWSGALTDVDTNEQVAEIYNGAGKVYQVLENMPAGDYTLTVNAFLRATTNEAYIFINDTKKVIANHDGDCDNLNGARLAFEGGKYLNTVTATHKGGDMVIGIMNPKSELYEWMAFDNFKLVNGTVDCTDKIVNADFSEESGLDFVKNGWTCKSGKTPELKRGGGNYSKTNASGYDIHQTVTLPAGKYRFAANTFLRHGAGNTAGGAWSIKAGDGAGIGTWYETTSAYDRHVANAEDPTWAAYIYVNEGEWDDDLEGLEEDGLFYYATPIKCLFDLGDELGLKNTELPDNAWEGSTQDSGDQSQSSEFFIKYADATSHYVEFTLDAETEVSMGIKKAVNAPERYWNAFADLRLEKFGPKSGAGVDNVLVDEADENAPVEYYNLQGVRVENPANGLYIKVQGKKATKVLVR